MTGRTGDGQVRADEREVGGGVVGGVEPRREKALHRVAADTAGRTGAGPSELAEVRVAMTGLTAIGGWGPYPTFTWNPQAKGDYQVSVAVRSAGNTAAEGEVSATKAFSIK